MLSVLQKVAIAGRVDVVPFPASSKGWAFIKALSKPSPLNIATRVRNPIVSLDPGETTGLAVWDPSSSQILLTQLDTKDIGRGFDSVAAVINYLVCDRPSLAHVRYEDYRVYGHMTEQHAFNNLHTAQMIGAILVSCHLAQVPHSTCLAMHAKSFWDDTKLKLCGLYSPGLKHARDAQRHLLRYMGEE